MGENGCGTLPDFIDVLYGERVGDKLRYKDNHYQAAKHGICKAEFFPENNKQYRGEIDNKSLRYIT